MMKTCQTERTNVAKAKPKIDKEAERLLNLLDRRPLVLIGMMGAGKTTIGRRVAARLGQKFIDSDTEIEHAAGMTIVDFFEKHGEAEFRTGEARVVSRILEQKNIVLGTGGGVFMNDETRSSIKAKAVSVWIKADFELLFSRISRRTTRPLLKTKNPRETLKKLIEERYPTYKEADITLVSRDVPHDMVVSSLIKETIKHLEQENGQK